MPLVRSAAAACLVCLACSGEPSLTPGLSTGHAERSVGGPQIFQPSSCATQGRRVPSGRGTAVVDGVLGAGEWRHAYTLAFTANVPGGGTTPATLYVMNDDRNLYVAVRFARTVVDAGGNSLGLEFDNNDDCVRENGDDAVVMNAAAGFFDDFRTNQPPCPPGSPPAACGPTDVEAGGRNDGSGAFVNDGAFSVYEISHPLRSGDTGHDFDLQQGDSVGMFLFLRMIDGASQYGDTTFPASSFLSVRIGAARPACARATPASGPVWSGGSYFPRFPATDHLFVLPARTPLEDQQVSWTPTWRISDSPETMDALTLVGMQGLINRDTPCVYLDWVDPLTGTGSFWLSELANHVTLEQVDLEGGAAIDFLYQEFSDRFLGAVVYDPQIPDTINLATMIAGLDNRIIVAPQQLSEVGVPGFADTIDLRQLAASEGWDATDAGRLKLYQWAHDHLGPRLDKRIVGVISPGPPTSGQIPGIPQFNPLGLAGRDLLVALRAPVLWLDTHDAAHLALYGQFLADARSPIVVTGGDDEEPTVSLISQHGDWEAAINWPNTPLSGGDLTAFAGIRVPVQPYVAELDPDRILATLGTAPVATIFSSDGDNFQFQLDRGFHGGLSFVWDEVQGHRFAWTSNAAMTDLAPMVWNYFVNSADKVTFIGGVSGTGYMYPNLMSSTQLRDYLKAANDHQQRTGLRVMQIDTRKGPYEAIAFDYYARLKSSGYLGAFFGNGGVPVLGLAPVWAGVPTPGVPMAFTPPILPSGDAVLAELPGRKLGDFILRLANWPSLTNNIGQVVADAAAPGGQAILYPASTSGCCQAFTTTPQRLLAGTYTVRMSLKVADKGSSANVAELYAGVQGASLLGNRVVRAADFTQAGQWQTFSFTFTLTDLTAGVFINMSFFPGVTDLSAAELHVTRDGVDPMPAFSAILISLVGSAPKKQLPALAEQLEAAGVVVLTADEFMAALNPEYMIDFARPYLGPGHPAIRQAQAQLRAGQFMPALLTIRTALQNR